MEHYSLIAAFGISSLREHLRLPFLALKTATAVPTFAADGDGLSYLIPVNSTIATSNTFAHRKLISTIRGPAASALLLDHNQLVAVLLTILVLGTYLFLERKAQWSSKPLTPSYRWTDHPFPLIHTTTTTTKPHHQCSHYSHHAAKLMVSTHNTILRGLNAIYAQSFYIRPNTNSATDFLAYSSTVISFLHHHHSIEERIFFPAISAATKSPNFTDENTAQHRAFESALEDLHLYVTTTPAACFSAHTLRGMLDSLAPILTQHLHDEIPSILSLHDKLPSDTLKAIYDEMVTAAEQESDPFMWVLPITLFTTKIQTDTAYLQSRAFRLRLPRPLFPPRW
jgi:hemerythrin-like domain-containing protein